eukprot:TRINITY_DN712_c0_g1_i1.p1 TRINITY_DN712_c0_g1~~TRINITY_DN712_c0_g1_i1.p1  ORF type:complete len:362 (-),score=84.83 TRINITY_DN712_c0_g1_i1:1509-2594(-)
MYPVNWLSVDGSGSTLRSLDGLVRVGSWNVLAQAYVKSSFFPYTPHTCLRQRNRVFEVARFISSLDLDILCLQELDLLEEVYSKHFKDIGYDYVFAKRDRGKRDSSCIIFKTERFEVEQVKEVHFNDVEEFIYPSEQSLFLRHNVAVVARFKDLVTRKNFCVACVHAYWDPSFYHVKLSQMMMLRAAVSDVGRGVPSFVAGDFNAVPGSETYLFMLGRNVAIHEGSCGESLLEKAIRQLKMCILPDRLEEFVRRFGTFESPHFSSAYGKYKRIAPSLVDVPKSFLEDILHGWDHTDDPAYTTATHKFGGCIDHIFFHPDCVRLCGVLEIPPASHLFQEVKGLPNTHCPSDHLPIAAVFDCK